jgi:adenosylhomocysteine nucleosidase
MTSQPQAIGGTRTEQLAWQGDEIGQVADFTAEPRLPTVIALVGMNFEAKIAAGPGVQVVCRSAERDLAAVTQNAARQGYRGIISFGVAGGLASHLRAGDWVVASAVIEAQLARSTHAAWSNSLVEMIGGASYAPILGVDVPVAEPRIKRDLHRTTGAAAVDMESHVVARLAAAHGLAFAAVRVIVDPADRAIPPAALLGMASDGRADIWSVLGDLLARPAQLSLFLRVTVDAFIARTELLRVRRLLGPHFGSHCIGRHDESTCRPTAPSRGRAARQVASGPPLPAVSEAAGLRLQEG